MTTNKYPLCVSISFSKPETVSQETYDLIGEGQTVQGEIEKAKNNAQIRFELCKKLGFKGEKIEDGLFQYSGIIEATSYKEALSIVHNLEITGGASLGYPIN